MQGVARRAKCRRIVLWPFFFVTLGNIARIFPPIDAKADFCYTFAMKSEKQAERLDKVLSNNGFGSRKDVKWMVKRGVVQVNGKVILEHGFLVSPFTDEIFVDGKKVFVRGDVYLMMNKAKNTICSTVSDSYPTVFDFLPDDFSVTYPGGSLSTVGRLDVDTEGLLLLTSDGDLNHRLTFPKYHIPKEYLVHLKTPVLPAEQAVYKNKLKMGVHIQAEGKAPEADCLPCELEWILSDGEERSSVCKITVFEGKFHEIKRIFLSLGNEVVYLKRLSVNNLKLDEKLAPGEWRELTLEELNLLSSLGREAIDD